MNKCSTSLAFKNGVFYIQGPKVYTPKTILNYILILHESITEI